MHEKSRASLITGETAVLTIAADISCVTYWRRFRITSSVTGSRMRHLDDEVAERLDPGAIAGAEEDRRVAPLDERGAGEHHARRDALAVVDRHARRRRSAREPRRTRAAACRLGIRAAERRRARGRARRAGRDQPAVDEVDARAMGEGAPAVELDVARTERRLEIVGERDRDLPRLAAEA